MTEPAMQIAFPKQTTGTALAVPEPPAAPVTQGLAQAATTAQPTTALTCSQLLQGSTLQRAQTEAAQLLPKMLQNTQVQMTYGNDALAGMNRLIDQLLHEVGPVKIPELQQLMHNLNEQMRAVQRKYDVSDPKVKASNEKLLRKGRTLLHRGRSLFDQMKDDITSIDSQLQQTEATLAKKQHDMLRNVGLYDRIYSENEAEIMKVIYVIAVMELVRNLAAENASRIQPNAADPADRSGEQKAKLAEFASNMDVKIAEYKARLYIGWSSSPRIRTMRTLDVGLAEKVNELCNVTIPTMKFVILQWRMQVEAQDVALMSQAVSQSSNVWTQEYAKAGAVVMPQIAEAVQTPTMTPETISALATTFVQATEGIIGAMEAGAQRRAANDAAMIENGKLITDASRRLSDAQVQQIVGAAVEQPIELVGKASAAS